MLDTAAPRPEKPYVARTDEVSFLLRHVVGFERLTALAPYKNLQVEDLEQIMEAVARFCEDRLQPLNAVGDREGCTHYPDGSVTAPPGFVSAFSEAADLGMIGLAANAAYGGLGLPVAARVFTREFMIGANISFSMYTGLTMGAIAMLERCASDKIRDLYLPPMVAGRWTGAMNLTEPHAGTDLGRTRTKAIQTEDGSYQITGSKIFISAGEHDLAENIVHLVLARVDGAPDGAKGLSLFVVPKLIPDETGQPGLRNAVSCVSIEHKMGCHGCPACVMQHDGSVGWLVGREGEGLKHMFIMMNEARLGVTIQGVALSDAASQLAARYAMERRQGVAFGAVSTNEPSAILRHPDIRRMLVESRAINDAGRAAVLWASILSDVARFADTPDTRRDAHTTLALLTPILKGVLTERGLSGTIAAQQVFGGHGYIRDNGVEQYVRDARLLTLYEGANGIHALDLVGRKLRADGGVAMQRLMDDVEAELSSGVDQFASAAESLSSGLAHLRSATDLILSRDASGFEETAAGATDYMHLAGLVVLGLMWLRILKATVCHADGTAQTRARLAAAAVFFDRIMPETTTRIAAIRAPVSPLMDFPDDLF